VQGTDLVHGFMVQIFWIAAASIMSTALWRGGLRRFEAFGI
jgi:ABC-type uncharacterized transport system permease subunit